MESTAEPSCQTHKKILILSSKGGYGHVAASLAIQEIGKSRYLFQEVFPIEEMNRLGTCSGENFYNALLKRNWIRTTNFLSNQLAPCLFYARQEGVEALMTEYLRQIQPDLVLSLVPFINHPAIQAAQSQGVPYLLVTTDNDLRNWVLGLEKTNYSKFEVTVGYDQPLTTGLLLRRGVAKEKIHQTGLPIHPSFFQVKQGVKEEMNIPLHKPVVTIMMGGAGGGGSFAYAKALAEIGFPLHVIVCTGNNHLLYRKMQQFVSNDQGVSFTILGFTNKVADLLQISDLLITKPGPGTINEAMARRLPILVDNVHSTLSWEKTNLDFIASSCLGKVLHRVEDVKKWAFLYLHDEEYKKQVANAYEGLKLPLFEKHIVSVVDSLLGVSV